MESDSDFKKLLAACDDVSSHFPEGVCFIGGIAVYLHVINTPEIQGFAESTHDADFYISLSDMADLRDIEEVTPNRRLSKHQMIKRGFEFDIYTERQSNLIVPYDVVVSASTTFDAVRVACPEHLLALKLEAFADRKGSAKGEKDAKDLIRIAMCISRRPKGLDVGVVLPYIRDNHLALLDQVQKGSQFLALARGNAHLAKDLRMTFQRINSALHAAYENRMGGCAPR